VRLPTGPYYGHPRPSHSASIARMIRSATPADVPTIARLIRALAEYEKLSHEVVLSEEDLRQHLFGDKPYAEVVLAEDAGQVVGFALFFHNYSTFLAKPGLYLEDLFVFPEHRGRGHGKKLLSHLAKLAVERGCGRFEWAVLDWNTPAIEFYKSFGAVPMHDWTVFRVTGDAMKRLAQTT
jgi:GNAT superfamily N-acetyltransferase